MKVPFDIKFRPQIESGEYKVETKDGRGVRIVCWDAKRTHNDCICGLMGEEEEHPSFWQLNGCWWADNTPSFYDLFIITPEPELSEWQTIISGCLQKYGLLDCGAADRIAKECSSELLDLATEEIGHKWVIRQESYQDGYINGLHDGKAKALKDLPRWETADKPIVGGMYIVRKIYGGLVEYSVSGCIQDGDEYLIVEKLDKLPKED
jgi:hypothetical protein